MPKLQTNPKTQPNYQIHNLKYIQDEFIGFMNDCENAKERFDGWFPNESTTWSYDIYNIFSLTSGSLRFYKLFNDIKRISREYLKTDEPLWLQSWLNYHNVDEVLDWHVHVGYSAHGYVSINPMKTKTIFEHYEIENEIGKLYIGEPYMRHKVEVIENFNRPRITIAFDVLTQDNLNKSREEVGNKINLSQIPI